MTVGSAIPAVKARLVDVVLPALFPAATVAYGLAGTSSPGRDVVAVGNAQVESTQQVMGATRPRREDATLDVAFSCFRAGGPEQQRAATEAAFTMLGAFADHFRTAGNETLGGACSNAYVSAYDLDESTDEELLERGRYSIVTATLTVQTYRLA